MDAVRLIVAGRVQGVGFRDAMCAEARRLGLTGWVRNRGDGSVEALACGSATALEALLAWAKHGPPAARVDRLAHTTCPAEPGEAFVRLPTA